MSDALQDEDVIDLALEVCAEIRLIQDLAHAAAYSGQTRYAQNIRLVDAGLIRIDAYGATCITDLGRRVEAATRALPPRNAQPQGTAPETRLQDDA